MPSISWNEQGWGSIYLWPAEGDEWSGPWGNAENQWSATILPRIRRFLPTGTLVEIAPGHGRWTKHLLGCCDKYIGVDLTETCVETCKERFSAARNATFLKNDGKSLSGVADNSIGFVFSFDSLVHAEADVIDAYMAELARVLTLDGVGFIHHSNIGEYLTGAAVAALTRKAVAPIPFARSMLRRLRMVDWDHARAKSMTAERFVAACSNAGLACIGQEIIEWGSVGKMIDCLSLVARPGSRWYRPNVVVRNPYFLREAFSASRMAQVYWSLREPPHRQAS